MRFDYDIIQETGITMDAIMRSLTPAEMYPVLCYLIDRVAFSNDIESVKLLDQLKPTIAAVNNDMGNDGL